MALQVSAPERLARIPRTELKPPPAPAERREADQWRGPGGTGRFPQPQLRGHLVVTRSRSATGTSPSDATRSRVTGSSAARRPSSEAATVRRRPRRPRPVVVAAGAATALPGPVVSKL